MFERFTEDARRVVVLAQEEARLLDHHSIGTEHLLLALLRTSGTVAAEALGSLDLSLTIARAEVAVIVQPGTEAPSGHIPFTPRAKKVLELSLREALQLGHDSIGTEHILLGLVREGQGVAAQVLVKLGADLERVRARVIDLLARGADTERTVLRTPPGPSLLANPMSPVGVERCAFCGRDLWDVDRYVRGEGAAICDSCIEACHRTAGDAAEGQRALDLPPRVFGSDLGDPEAPASIGEAFGVVFDGTTDEYAERLEDGARIIAFMRTIQTGLPERIVQAVRVDRIRFVSADEADVRFSIVLREGRTGYAFDGRAVRGEGRWMVSRDTFAQRVAAIGIQLPPPE